MDVLLREVSSMKILDKILVYTNLSNPVVVTQELVPQITDEIVMIEKIGTSSTDVSRNIIYTSDIVPSASEVKRGIESVVDRRAREILKELTSRIIVSIRECREPNLTVVEENEEVRKKIIGTMIRKGYIYDDKEIDLRFRLPSSQEEEK